MSTVVSDASTLTATSEIEKMNFAGEPWPPHIKSAACQNPCRTHNSQDLQDCPIRGRQRIFDEFHQRIRSRARRRRDSSERGVSGSRKTGTNTTHSHHVVPTMALVGGPPMPVGAGATTTTAQLLDLARRRNPLVQHSHPPPLVSPTNTHPPTQSATSPTTPPPRPTQTAPAPPSAASSPPHQATPPAAGSARAPTPTRRCKAWWPTAWTGAAR